MKNYLDGITITSKYSPKYDGIIRDFANKVSWLQRHRNYVVSLGLVYKNGSLSGSTIITHKDGILKQPAEILEECIKLFDTVIDERNTTLSFIAVNGGNGTDRPNRTCYHIYITP